MRIHVYYTLVVLFFFVFNSVIAQNVISENIYFLKEDGKSYLKYFTTRSDYKSYWIAINKNVKIDDYYQYLYPPDRQIDTLENEWYNKLRFNEGSYAAMVHDSFKASVTIDSMGVYTFRNNSSVDSKGRFGIWNDPVPFSRYTYVWVLPNNFEFVSYYCNKQDDNNKWKQNNNTLTFFGKNVNNLVFNIQYRRKDQERINNLKKAVASIKTKGITVEKTEEGSLIVLSDSLVFRAGSINLRSKARTHLSSLLEKIKVEKYPRIIISGHTDATPINKSKYKSNWELSALRALAILEVFIEEGFEENQLEIRAFGATKPRVKNKGSEEKNRRIEILLPSASSEE